MLQTLASSWTACTADPVELPWRRWIHAWTLCPSPCPPHSNRHSALWRHPCVSWTPSQLWLSEPCEEKQMFKTQKLIISMFNIWNMYYEVSVNLLVNLTNIVGSFNFIRLCVVWIIDNKLDIQNTMGETLEQLTCHPALHKAIYERSLMGHSLSKYLHGLLVFHQMIQLLLSGLHFFLH